MPDMDTTVYIAWPRYPVGCNIQVCVSTLRDVPKVMKLLMKALIQTHFH